MPSAASKWRIASALRPAVVPGTGGGFWLWRPSHRHWLGHLLLAPGLLVTALLVLYPLALAFDLSFRRVRLMRVGAPSAPLTWDNYLRLGSSAEFWHAGMVSLLFVLFVTIGCFAVGMGAALLVNERFPGRRAARLLVALPWAVPEVVAAAIWSWLFDAAFGLVNWLLLHAGLISAPITWLGEPRAAFAVCASALIWTGYPFVAVMALAGLQAIPGEFFEAAQMDGARALARFRHVTLPCLRPVCLIALVLVVLRTVRDFAIVFAITGGGPAGATRSLAIYTYEQAFSFYNIGFAAAVGVVTLAFCGVFSAILVRGVASSPSA